MGASAQADLSTPQIEFTFASGNYANTGTLGGAGTITGGSGATKATLSAPGVNPYGNPDLSSLFLADGGELTTLAFDDGGLFDVGNAGGYTGMTASFWVKPTNLGQILIGRENDSTVGWAWASLGDGKMRFSAKDNDDSTSATNLLTVGQWQFMTVTWDKAPNYSLRMYRNGVDMGYSSWWGGEEPNSAVTHAIQFGSGNNYGGTRGNYSNIQMWGTAATSGEVAALYATEMAKIPRLGITTSDRMVFANIMLCLPFIDEGGYWWCIPERPWDSGFSSRPSIWMTNPNAADRQLQASIDFIRSMKSYGIDGVIACMTDPSKDGPRFNSLVDAATSVGGFYVCIQPDLTCSGVNPTSIYPHVANNYQKAGYLKINGKPAVIPYCCGYSVVNDKTWPDYFHGQGLDIAFIPSIATNLYATGYDQQTPPVAYKDPTKGYPTFAVGITSFTPISTNVDKQKVLDFWTGVLPYMAENSVQYRNRNVGYLQGHLTQFFRDTFKWAIDHRGTYLPWVQPLCYTDFGESAAMPNSNFFMAIAPIHKYYADWFKTGTGPKVIFDSVSVFHHVNPTAVAASRYNDYPTNCFADEVEAVALLTAPATLYLQSGSSTYSLDVGAGVQSLLKPQTLGIQKAWVVRNGVTVATVTAPVPVHDDPIRTNVWLAGFGSAYPEETVSLTPGDWSVLSGAMTINSASSVSATGAGGVALVNPSNYTLLDYRISTTATPTSAASGSSVGLIVCYSTTTQPATASGYFSFTLGNFGGTRQWQINRVDNGTATLLKSGSTSYTAGTPRTMRLDRVGDYLIAYLDGIQIAHTADWGPSSMSWQDERFGAGRGGVLATGAAASFADILLERYQPDLSKEQVEAPSFSLAAGTYSGVQNVTINCATSGMAIRYTTDGTMPSPTNGLLYSTPVNISGTGTLMAIAYKSGMRNSGVANAYYNINIITNIKAQVKSRLVFYNNSAFDGNDPTATAADDGAIAPDKQALLPGQTATFANYTSYSRGLNGIMVDISLLPGTPTAADFTFAVGNSNTPGSWAAAPAPSSITLRQGAGAGGSTRITIIWADNAIQKRWLQVTVKATASTGLAGPDVFYFGTAIGETGNSTTDAKVNLVDLGLVRVNQSGFGTVSLTSVYDFDRDKKVNLVDLGLVRGNQSGFTPLNLITVP